MTDLRVLRPNSAQEQTGARYARWPAAQRQIRCADCGPDPRQLVGVTLA